MIKTTTVGLIGLGAMGGRIAQNLIEAGYTIVIHNRSAEKARPLLDRGATFATTPRLAAEQSDVIISMVTDDAASRQVWLAAETGAIWGVSSGKIAIAMSTLTVDWVRELYGAIAECDADFLEVPVIGSRPQAEAGKLMALVGGEKETLMRVEPILTAAGIASIQHIGTVGQGMAMKLAVNALFGTQVAVLAELLAMLSRHDISLAKAMSCLENLPVLSPAAKGAGGLMVSENYAPLFPIHLVEKDLGYVAQVGQNLGGTMPISVAVGEVYRSAIARGHGDDNITGIVQLFL
ncbi:NAD(P)-dependent oxidoreductase [Roseofilum casamattae]|uniref:NAD(P)-dependent oxidoreductase n=1 Tax=Roseofilum casamattae BLCC-M143 TaxID=3022442 RepID=A0ABT7BQU2_9CYAN|nr:NAD(P)-dependent oxidoreductase [Roseofilum casamattae]MDJ1181572.1 NAD(P)-dependent oxidoreductase [Roseofilum casamattae BLCC-M143]